MLVSTYAPTIRCPSAYCATESGTSTSMRLESSHPACPLASRTSHQSSRIGAAASPCPGTDVAVAAGLGTTGVDGDFDDSVAADLAPLPEFVVTWPEGVPGATDRRCTPGAVFGTEARESNCTFAFPGSSRKCSVSRPGFRCR